LTKESRQFPMREAPLNVGTTIDADRDSVETPPRIS